jgi:hypothetical protein
MATRYRIIVGETGNEQGHIIDSSAATPEEATLHMRRELEPYHGDGWGRIEANDNDGDPTAWYTWLER